MATYRGSDGSLAIPALEAFEGASASVSEAVLTRFSCRRFLKRPVDPATVREIITLSARAASGGNLQPWKVYVLYGEKRDQLCAAVLGRVAKGRMERPAYPIYPDQKSGGTLGKVYKDRRGALGEEMFSLLGIQRHEKARRMKQLQQNWDFFGAPVGLLVTTPREMGPPQWADLGLFLATLNLLARERGLHTCNQESWAMHPNACAEVCGIPKEDILFCGVSLGYADMSAPVNKMRVPRAPPAEFAKFLGFPSKL
eukprot:TRINITY_DN47589_c0_g1_i1.p1 TRINITY_DN47589_c0_g1~~TRINITY_DN47589_c0_g1_i1.p1  ORF type:complete len:255 (+),score=74.33 TRINITY_DN47589_c0_g1_i1:80-844(+)